MALLREELRTEVVSNLGDRDEAGSGAGLTRVNNALDLAQLRIARTHYFAELNVYDTDAVVVTGAVATDTVYSGFPATTRAIHSLLWQETGETTSYHVQELLSRQWAMLVGAENLNDTGTPVYYQYFVHDGTQPVLRWYPTPDVNYTLYRGYSKWPADMSEGNPSDLINKDDLIIAMATHGLFQGLGHREDAQQWFAIAMDLLKAAQEEDSRRPNLARVPRGLKAATTPLPEYWRDPFVKEDP